MSSARSFGRFLFSSGVATAISMAVFEAARLFMNISVVGWHVVAVAVAYFAAARVNFELQRRWVFADIVGGPASLPFHLFLAGNGTISVAVGVISASLARWPLFAAVTGSATPLMSLLVGAGAVAPVSYLLMRWMNASVRPNDRKDAGCAP